MMDLYTDNYRLFYATLTFIQIEWRFSNVFDFLGGKHVLRKEIVKIIDHTNLQPTATKEEIEQLCREAKEEGFYAVCVHPCYVKTARFFLKESGVKICTVVGFPLGANDWETKAAEAELAIENGAEEIDFVINLGFVKSGFWEQVEEEIKQITVRAKNKGKMLNKNIIVKVIVETCYLEEEEKIKLCNLVKQSGADYIKTSTGFGTAGAEVKDIELFKQIGGGSLKIKAAGGIRTLAKLQEMVKAGADRIGTSSAMAIIQEITA
jgi:deoxyribose-phosphate aldolase